MQEKFSTISNSKRFPLKIVSLQGLTEPANLFGSHNVSVQLNRTSHQIVKIGKKMADGRRVYVYTTTIAQPEIRCTSLLFAL